MDLVARERIDGHVPSAVADIAGLHAGAASTRRQWRVIASRAETRQSVGRGSRQGRGAPGQRSQKRHDRYGPCQQSRRLSPPCPEPGRGKNCVDDGRHAFPLNPIGKGAARPPATRPRMNLSISPTAESSRIRSRPLSPGLADHRQPSPPLARAWRI